MTSKCHDLQHCFLAGDLKKTKYKTLAWHTLRYTWPCWSHNLHYHNKLRKLVWAALFNSVSKCNSVLKVCIYSSFWKVTFLFSTVSRVWFKGLFHLKQGGGGDSCWELESILELLSFLKQAPSSTITERTCQNMQ